MTFMLIPHHRRVTQLLCKWLDKLMCGSLVIVFDGEPPPEKGASLAARRR